MSKPESIQTIDQLAAVIIKRKMTAPAVFLLELSKPISGLAREIYGVTQGLQQVVFGREILPVINQLLSSVEQIEALILLLEKQPAAIDPAPLKEFE